MHSVLFLLILTVLSTVSTFHFTYQTNALSAPLSAIFTQFYRGDYTHRWKSKQNWKGCWFDFEKVWCIQHFADRAPSSEQMYPSAPWCCTAAAGYYPQQVPGYYPGYCPQQVLFTLAWVLDQCIHALCTAGTHPFSKDTRQMFFFFAHFFAQLVSILSQKTLVKCSCFFAHLVWTLSQKSNVLFLCFTFNTNPALTH